MKRKLSYFLGAVLILVLLAGAGFVYQNDWNSSAAAANTPVTLTSTNQPTTTAQTEVAGLLPTQETLSALYNTISPSVVNIQVVVDTPQQVQQMPFPDFPFGSPFGDQQPNLPEPQPSMGEGSGFVYDTDGHIVTNNHVVADAKEIIVNFSDGHWARAELVATDPQADLAVIKVAAPKGMDLQPLKLAPTSNLRVGYYVLAIGSPFGLDETLTLGVVSALGRSLPTGSEVGTGPRYSLPDLIQTDAAINPGNSGGPLLDLNGDVVGVNFAINSPVQANSGVGFAIPVSVVEKVVPALIHDGAYHYSYLGLSGQTVTAMLAEQENLADDTQGVYVADVVAGGPTAQAGLQAGDILVGIDDQPVVRFEDLLSYLFNRTEPGQTVTLHVLRNGSEKSLNVQLAERPGAEQAAAAEQEAAVTIGEAINIAKQAVSDAGMTGAIESASAKGAMQNGRSVWIVTLSGGEESATVTVDAQTGEVLELNIE